MELLTWPFILMWDLFQIVIILTIYYLVARFLYRKAKHWCQKQSASEQPTQQIFSTEEKKGEKVWI